MKEGRRGKEFELKEERDLGDGNGTGKKREWRDAGELLVKGREVSMLSGRRQLEAPAKALMPARK